jgi:hypothetical protein
MRKVSWALWCAHSAAEKPARQLTQNESLPLLLLPEWPCAAPGSASAWKTTSWPWPRWCAPQQWWQKAAGYAEAVLLAAGGEVLREEPLDPPAAD